MEMSTPMAALFFVNTLSSARKSSCFRCLPFSLDEPVAWRQMRNVFNS